MNTLLGAFQGSWKEGTLRPKNFGCVFVCLFIFSGNLSLVSNTVTSAGNTEMKKVCWDHITEVQRLGVNCAFKQTSCLINSSVLILGELLIQRFPLDFLSSSMYLGF